jgi:hypothetical protein
MRSDFAYIGGLVLQHENDKGCAPNWLGWENHWLIYKTEGGIPMADYESELTKAAGRHSEETPLTDYSTP